MPPSSMHNSNAQPGKLDGILYRTGCVINQKDPHPDEQDVSTNVTTASSSAMTTASQLRFVSGRVIVIGIVEHLTSKQSRLELLLVSNGN